MADKQIALLLYGHGAELGNFRLFADDIATELVQTKAFDRKAIVIQETLSREAFFDAIRGVPDGTKVKQLHVFSHSIGGGLYVGYHERTADMNRNAAVNAFLDPKVKIPYERVLAAETGGILTDHLLYDPLKSDRAKIRTKFAAGAFAKFWGCNSGRPNWTYRDEDSTTTPHSWVSDQNAKADIYYWRALNTRNIPKPSIAQALADYLGITVYGAGSGSHIEVKYQGKWVTSAQYLKATGKSVGAPQVLRLHPDVDDYKAFPPKKP